MSPSDETIRVGVIGAGYWGKNMLRVISESPRCELIRICDLDPELAATAAKRHGCEGTTDVQKIFKDKSIEAVYIATPPSTHADLARQALENGKHALVEKPITDRAEDASELIDLAAANQRTLMVGHTFLYSPPVMKIKDLITTGTMGEVFYIDSQRVNLGKYQSSGVLWDLAPHDLSMMLYWLGEIPNSVKASGRSYRSNGREDVVFLTLEFPSGAIAQMHMSWLAPVKLRRTTVSGSQRMVVYDDTAGPEAIKIFNHGVDRSEPSSFGEYQLSYRQGDIWIPRLENAEPLSNEWRHFMDCIATGETPRSSAEQGLCTVSIIEACEASLVSGKREAVGQDKLARRALTPRPRFGVADVTTPQATETRG
jgi:predicted dehydrogenase